MVAVENNASNYKHAKSSSNKMNRVSGFKNGQTIESIQFRIFPISFELEIQVVRVPLLQSVLLLLDNILIQSQV